MNISVKDLKDNHVEIIVTATPEEFSKHVTEVYNKIAADVSVEGFRKGKVPQGIFEKKYGRDSLYQDAIDGLIQACYMEALKENKDLEIVAYPKVDLVKFEPETEIEIKYTVATRPEVKLGKYKGIKVEEMSTDVTEDDIKAEITRMLERYSEMEIIEEAADFGDTVVIDYEGFKDNVAFAGGKADNHSLELGSGQFIPGFEEQLVGVKEGDSRELSLTFPEQYHSEDLAGADVVFKVTVHEVKRKIVPELTAEIIEKLELEDVKTEADLEKHVIETLKTQKENEAKEKLQADVIAGLVEVATVDLPEEMIDMQVDRMLNNFGQQMSGQGFSLEQYYQLTGTDEGALREQMRPDAEKQLKESLALEAVVDAEKIEVTEAEIATKLDELAEMYQMKADDIKGMIPNLADDMKIQKAIDFLIENHK